MKKTSLYFIFLIIISFTHAQVTTSPSTFNTTDTITITVDLLSSNTDCNTFSNPTKVYMHSGIGDNSNPWGYKVVGNWGTDDGIGEMTNNSNGTWSITINPKVYYNLSDAQAATATKMGMVFRNAAGSQELKASGCSDFIINVGSFQVTLTNPVENSAIILATGETLNITATHTNGTASYNLKSNGIIINTNTATSNYAFNHTNITSNQNYILEITQASTTITKTFSVIVNPNISNEVLPTGLVEGINYNENDGTKATLVIDAPFKDFIYVAGSFNNWQPDAIYAMKKDSSSTKFWLELTGLTSGKIETYQYWVVDQNPVSNSPVLVKTADPFSTLVLSPFDDPYIPSASYPNLPVYPVGQEREVTVLQTGQTNYSWQVTNFSKPKKEDLIIYEVLIRDFDVDRNFQDVIDKISYFKNLNINAIELMPIMEFEGNESWGYNTSFHMALDKFYGTSDKFKELVDVCHQNGIAVILDVALNHAFGRNPMVRMWMNDPDKDGWGAPSTENPYFNTTAKHSYSVGEDFNHQSTYTQNYVKGVVNHWISEYKIDGFRWDLTKGFTQNCTSGDESCTNSYQQDRVDVLKAYTDYSWSLDETHYVIFEHLGGDTEEQEWANYRIGDAIPKGVMMWSEMWTPYKNLAQGQTGDINFDRMGNTAHGFTAKRTLGYPESHDKDRIMYEMTQFGVTTNPSHNVRDLNTALLRMSALGAVTIPIPGPKMLWHFADLGMDNSIWTCDNGIVNTDYDANNDGDCKLSTKPQPQWVNNWLGNSNRNQIYNDWSRLNALKIKEDVFEGSYSISSGTQMPRISIYTGNENTSGANLKNVIIIANFSVTNQNVNPNFPYTGTWYDLIDTTGDSTINGSTTSITLEPGAFKIYGNQKSLTLTNKDFESTLDLNLYPNPTKSFFQLNKPTKSVTIYDITGKVILKFTGDFEKYQEFNISNVKQGFYLVKVEGVLGISTKRLIIR